VSAGTTRTTLPPAAAPIADAMSAEAVYLQRFDVRYEYPVHFTERLPQTPNPKPQTPNP
jgi:hypothetical protein